MRAVILAVVVMLSGCQSAPPAVHAPRGSEMPRGTGPVQYEPGLSRLCQQDGYEGCR